MTASEFRSIRIKLGLTQAQLASKLGYSRRPTITEKESGRTPITKQDEIILKHLPK